MIIKLHPQDVQFDNIHLVKNDKCGNGRKHVTYW